MVLKMLALYPRREDVDFTLEAFVEELRDIPWRTVSGALHDITEEPGRVFGPSISEVKAAVARRIRRFRRKVSGGALPEDTGEIRELHAAREIDWFRERVSDELRRGLLPPGVSAREANAHRARIEAGEPVL